jgi:hypothetical protein
MELAMETLIVSRGYGLSSLNLSQYMSGLFKEEMDLDTQRFQMATTVNLSETIVDRTIRHTSQNLPLVEKTTSGSIPRVEKTPITGRTPSTSMRSRPEPRTHPVLNLFLWGALFLLISVPILVYTSPHLVLKALHQQTWLHPMEDSLRHHLENLGVVQSADNSIPTPQDEAQSPTQPESPQVPAMQEPTLAMEERRSMPEQPTVPAPVSESPARSTQPPEPRSLKPAPPVKPPEIENAEVRQLFFVAKRQYEVRDLDGLESTLRKIIEKDPGAARAYHLLGTLYLERKDEETALRIFSEAVNLFPRDAMLHHDLGTLYYKRGFTELARQELSKALEVAPNFPKAEQTRQLLLSLREIKPDQPLQEPPPPPLVPSSTPQNNMNVQGETPEQKVDEPAAQENPEIPDQGKSEEQPLSPQISNP